MSTTLTNGLKLPDKGSVDWYADMQNNYAILDGSVGTIAAHTSALSGKAPLVHTHVKADITDLFNSANTWTAEQTITNNFHSVKETNYELGQSYPNGNHLSGLQIKDKNGATVGLLDIVDRSYGNMEMRIRVQQKFDPNSNNRSTSGDILYNEMIIGITPTKTNYVGVNADLWGANTYNLGTASSQWNNLYAKNYYYNGVAWGLDKVNVWTGENIFSAANLFRKRAFTLGDNSSQIVRMEYKDTNNTRWGILSFIQDTDNTVHCDIGVHTLRTDGQAVLNKSVTLIVKPDNSSEFKPINDKAIDLGTSTNKWKTLNGVNPGALSFPNLEYSNSNKWIDIASSITKTNGSDNWYYPAVDGWVFIIASGGAAPDLNVLVFIDTGFNLISGVIPAAESTTGTRWCQCLAPAGSRVRIRFNKGSTSCSIEKALFIPCQGNV